MFLTLQYNKPRNRAKKFVDATWSWWT